MATLLDTMLDPETIQEIVEETVDDLIDICVSVLEAMQDADGRVYPYVDPGRVQRLMSFINDAQRGVIDTMLTTPDRAMQKQGRRLVSTAREDAKGLGIVPRGARPFVPTVQKVV